MSLKPKPGAVVFAKDPARVAKFYEVIAGLSVVQVENGHVILESGVIQVVVHAIPQRIADTITIASPPKLRDERAVKLFFPVASLAEARDKALAMGGGLSPVKKEWEARGFRACDGYDPEGNVVQFREDVA
jgi:predicted enzyme related to lactoylglutathione lyase